MAAAVILNYYFVTLDNPRSPFVVLNLPFKFCIDRDIVIWKFCKLGLNAYSGPQKSCFREFWPLNFTFLSSRPPKGTSLCRNTRFEPLPLPAGRVTTKRPPSAEATSWAQCATFSAFWALIGRDRSYGVIWMRRDVYKKKPFPSSHISQILPAGSYPRYLSWFWVSLRSVEKCGSSGGSKFRPTHWLGTSLIQQLVAIAQAVMHIIRTSPPSAVARFDMTKFAFGGFFHFSNSAIFLARSRCFRISSSSFSRRLFSYTPYNTQSSTRCSSTLYLNSMRHRDTA